MNNYEIINKFDDDTKDYLSVVFSMYDFLKKENFSIKLINIDGDEYLCPLTEQTDLIALSFFLASFYTDHNIQECFADSKVTFDNFSNYLISDSATLNDFKVISNMSETNSFDEIGLTPIVNAIINDLKNKYSFNDENIKYEDIKPSIILNYIYDYYADMIDDVIDSISYDENRDGFEDNNYYFSKAVESFEDYMKDDVNILRAKYNLLDIDEEDDEVIELCLGDLNILYDNKDLFFVTNSAKEYEVNAYVDGVETLVSIPSMTQILAIDDEENINLERFKEISESFNEDSIEYNKDNFTSFTIYDPLSKETKNIVVKNIDLMRDDTIKKYDLGKYTIQYDVINGLTKLYDTDSSINSEENNSLVVQMNDEAVNDESFDRIMKNVFDNNEELKLHIVKKNKESQFLSLKVNKNSTNKKASTPNLDKYGTDLTKKNYVKNPCMSREKELDEIMTTLLFPEKDRSIVITGDSGVGKTALVEGLCYKIQNGDVPKALKDLRIVSITASSFVSGNKYVGMLEERMGKIVKEASQDKNIVLFIDEIHQIIGAGLSEGNNMSVSEILKPYLSSGEIRVIGATTTDEYYEYIENSSAFKRRLERIDVKEPNDKVVYSIINDLIDAYNKISDAKLNYDEDERRKIIAGLIESTKKSYRDYKDKENNPSLIIGIVKRAYAIALKEGSNEVTIDHIITSLLSCQRLYESSRIKSARMLKSSIQNINKKPKVNVLQFKPKMSNR